MAAGADVRSLALFTAISLLGTLQLRALLLPHELAYMLAADAALAAVLAWAVLAKTPDLAVLMRN